MSNQVDRRRFLHTAAVGLGAVTLNQFLSACGSNAAPPPAAAATSAVQPTISGSQPGTTQAGSPELVVARLGEPEAMVRRAIAALGGMERFVPRDANVIIKPNICVAYHTYEYAATTNPWVVGALVKMCREAGAASVRVMDNPFGGTAEEAYDISGIAEQVKAAGGEMVVMSRMKFTPTELRQCANVEADGHLRRHSQG